MKIVVQKTSKAQVIVDGRIIGKISKGFVLFVGIKKGDTENIAKKMAEKVAKLRIFEDKNNKMNLSLKDTGGSVLAVSQFTLLADVKKGNRPSFIDAENPEKAKYLFDKFVEYLKEEGISVETGQFQAYMQVHIVNEGPTTILLDSEEIVKS